MNAPNGSAPPALAPVPMSDSGPLSWVFEELRQCLETADATLQCFVSDNATARGGDLAEVDSSELRLLGQQLHQAVGALELVELSAAARTLRALESAVRQLTQKPALASAEAAAAVSAGCRVLLDYLWRVLRQRPVSSEALLPTYLAWQQLAGAVRIHPADLWDCEPRTAPVPDQAPAPLTPEPALRTRIERHVLAVVKNRDPAAAAALVPLAGALARAATGPEAQQYWLAAAACFEALSGDALTDSVYLKRAVTGVLSQYKAMESGRVEQWARPTHELLYLIARVPLDRQRPDWAYFSAIWRTYAWQLPAAGAQPAIAPARRGPGPAGGTLRALPHGRTRAPGRRAPAFRAPGERAQRQPEVHQPDADGRPLRVFAAHRHRGRGGPVHRGRHVGVAGSWSLP